MWSAKRSRQARHLQLADNTCLAVQRQPQFTEEAAPDAQGPCRAEQTSPALVVHAKSTSRRVSVVDDKSNQRRFTGGVGVEDSRCGVDARS